MCCVLFLITIIIIVSCTDSKVYVPFPSLHPNQGYNLEITLKLQEINEEFADLLNETQEAIKKQSLPDIISYIEAHVVSLLNSKDQTQANKELVRNEFRHIDDSKELFGALEKYVSWFNYSFILKIVREFLHRENSLQRMWSAYENKLKDYFTNSEGRAIQCVNAVEFGLSDIPGTQAMIFKVERNDYTFSDLAIFYRQIPSALQVPNACFYFSFVGTGCLQLNYCIPNFLYSILFPLNEEQLHNLASIGGIIKLECGEYVYNINKVCNFSDVHCFHSFL